MTKNDLLKKLKDFDGEDQIIFRYFEDYYGVHRVENDKCIEISAKGEDSLSPNACVITIFEEP